MIIYYTPLFFVRYDNLRAFQKHVKDAFPLYTSPVHLIIGKNPAENQEAVQFLLDLFLPSKETRKLSLVQLEASQLEEAQLYAGLHSFTLFSKKSVTWIQNIDKLKKNVQELLEKFCSQSTSQKNIILTSSLPVIKNSSFYKTIEKYGSILEFVEMKPWEKEKQLMDWLPKQASLFSMKISYAACQKLIKQIGLDKAILSQELQKIICYCGAKNEITIEDVEAIGSYQSHETIWQLGEAIFDRDVKTALEISRSFLLDGQFALPLLRQLRSQFQTELQICLLLKEGKEGDIPQEFPYLKGQLFTRRVQQAQRYGLTACIQGIVALDAAEKKIKNSAIGESLLLDMLMIQLTRSTFSP